MRCAAFFYPHLPSPSVYRTLSFDTRSSHSFSKHASQLHAHSRTHQFRFSPIFDSNPRAGAEKAAGPRRHQYLQSFQRQGCALTQIEIYHFARTQARSEDLVPARYLIRLARNYENLSTHDCEYSLCSSLLILNSEYNLHADYPYTTEAGKPALAS